MMENDTRGTTPKVAKGKICDMVKEWGSKTDQPFISFEYFPPKTPEGVEKLHKVIDVMSKQDPLFMDFTWGAGGTTSDLTLDLSKESQTRHNMMVNMHLTCTNQTKEVCDYGLREAKKNGIWCAHAAGWRCGASAPTPTPILPLVSHPRPFARATSGRLGVCVRPGSQQHRRSAW